MCICRYTSVCLNHSVLLFFSLFAFVSDLCLSLSLRYVVCDSFKFLQRGKIIQLMRKNNMSPSWSREMKKHRRLQTISLHKPNSSALHNYLQIQSPQQLRNKRKKAVDTTSRDTTTNRLALNYIASTFMKTSSTHSLVIKVTPVGLWKKGGDLHENATPSSRSYHHVEIPFSST